MECGRKFLFVMAIFVCAVEIAPAQVTIYTVEDEFKAAVQAQQITLPQDVNLPPSDRVGLSLAFDGIKITAPNSTPTSYGGLGEWTLAYDVPPFSFLGPQNPNPSFGIIAANGEDDYLLTFATPTTAFGLHILTNFSAQQTVTLKDQAGNVIPCDSCNSVQNLAPNSLVFVGFLSSTPIASVFLDTTNGAIENEAIYGFDLASVPALDLSYSNPPESFWDEAKKSGIKVAVVQGWGGDSPNPDASKQLELARCTGGMQTGTYCRLNYRDSGATQISDECLPATKTEKEFLSFVAVDVEKGASADQTCKNNAAQQHQTSIIADAVKAVKQAGKTPVIYTNADWSCVTGNSTLFSGLLLWNVCSDQTPDLANDYGKCSKGPFQAFGGWQSRAGKQYDDGPSGLGTTLFGYTVDLDVFASSLFTSSSQPNTPNGTNVSAQPLDNASGTTPATISFASVRQIGTTTVATSSDGAAPPSGFRLGSPPVYYQLDTTAMVSGPIAVCINYSLSSFNNEANARLFHLEGGSWVDQTTLLDTANHIVCASVSSLSPFAVFEANPTPVFSGLSPSQTVYYGTLSIALAGQISAGSSSPPAGEAVSITIGSTNQPATIGNNGAFAVNFNPSSLPASATPYTISYQYAGDGNFNAASDTTTTLTVLQIADRNGDGVVNCADIAIVKASFGKKKGQGGFDSRADVNVDGVVNVVDLAIVSQGLPKGTKCP